jgi:uncharacterized protein (TIGR00266 family)
VQHDILHQPAHSLAVVRLAVGDEFNCEVGSVVSLSGGLRVGARAKETEPGGGLLARVWGAFKLTAMAGVDLMVARVSAESTGGEVTLAPSAPGDIVAVDLAEGALVLHAGSYLGSDVTVRLDGEWAGLRGLLGRSGLFFMRATGTGTLLVTSFGAIHRRALAPGERYAVRAGHLLGYRDGMGSEVRMVATEGSWLKRFFESSTVGGGMGLVVELEGPGEIWLQTRSPQAFVTWIDQRLPHRAHVHVTRTVAEGGGRGDGGGGGGGGGARVTVEPPTVAGVGVEPIRPSRTRPVKGR